MAVLNWGDLTKSQADNETIEEAIARLIAAHNADEESHLATGQSLQSHKASEIIDHLAQSVYRDKLIFNRFQIDEHFASIDGWGKSAGVTHDAISQITLNSSGVINTVRYCYLGIGDSLEDQALSSKDPIWQTSVKLDQITNQIIYIMQGDPEGEEGFGFKIVNGTLYATWFDDDNVEDTTEITGVTLTDYNIYRCELEDGVTLKWYINGVLKHTESSISPSGSSAYMYYYLKNTAAEEKIMYARDFHFDADYQ